MDTCTSMTTNAYRLENAFLNSSGKCPNWQTYTLITICLPFVWYRTLMKVIRYKPFIITLINFSLYKN
jgi:hypothetical protein